MQSVCVCVSYADWHILSFSSFISFQNSSKNIDAAKSG